MPGRFTHSADPSIQVATNLSSSLLDRLEARAELEGISRSEVIRNAVLVYLEGVAVHLNGGEA